MVVFIFLSVFLYLADSAAQTSIPYSIIVEPQNSVSVQAFGVAPVRQDTTGPASASVSGGERSDCREDYGRSSSAQATADTRVTEKSEEHVALTLTTSSVAIGGHYRTCALCAGNKVCIGIVPTDTIADAKALASARITFTHAQNYPPTDYFLDIGKSGRGAVPLVKLVDQNGIEIPFSGDSILLKGRPGAIYYLGIELGTNSTNKGGCCDDQKSTTARVDVRLRKAPLLESLATFEPFIRGGEQTSAYPHVGAILIDGRLHCTGTVVASRTILTAAHCLHGYENQRDKFTFAVGPNILQITHGPFAAKDFDYPKDPASGFVFNPLSLEDDIGLLYLAEPVNIAPARLHSKDPEWQSILTKKINLIFVGYGYDVIEQQKVGAGVKREASWNINRIENRRVSFEVPGKNTCKGDSGGPAFVVQGGALFQAAVTSGGNRDCTVGFETRVDAYSSWLKTRLR